MAASSTSMGSRGPGVYADGEPGSPIIALKSFLEHRYREKITAELIYIFIEENKERVGRLSPGKLAAIEP
jgi:hypothetical protein